MPSLLSICFILLVAPSTSLLKNSPCTTKSPHWSEGAGIMNRPTMNYESVHVSSKLSLSLRGGSMSSVPPLRVWIVPALVSSLAFSMYNLSIKKASDSIDPLLGGVILQACASVFGILLYITKQVLGKQSVIQAASSGIYWSVAAGIFVGMAELLSFIVSGMKVPASRSVPIIIGGSVLFGAILGNVWLKEPMSKSLWMGVFLIAAGIACISLGGGAGH